jgi:hypothetical protein
VLAVVWKKTGTTVWVGDREHYAPTFYELRASMNGMSICNSPLEYPVADVSQQVKPGSITKPCHVHNVRVFGNKCFRPLRVGHAFLCMKRMEFLDNSNMV